MAVDVDIKALLEAGVHFGHKTSRWHPKMAQYIHSKRQDSHIIDLTKTVEGLDTALAFLTRIATNNKQVLFVGTKRQAREIVREVATSIGEPYVVDRWLGGMLTNVATTTAQIRNLKSLESRMDTGDLANRYGKLEVQRFSEEIDALNHKYGGIKDMDGQPGAVFVTDVIEEANAIKEAKKLGIPVVAIVDTNANPDLVDYVIPGNDDAIKGIKLILDYAAAAIREGKGSAKSARAATTATTEAK